MSERACVCVSSGEQGTKGDGEIVHPITQSHGMHQTDIYRCGRGTWPGRAPLTPHPAVRPIAPPALRYRTQWMHHQPDWHESVRTVTQDSAQVHRYTGTGLSTYSLQYAYDCVRVNDWVATYLGV